MSYALFGRIFLLKQFTHALERERSVLSGREALHKSFYVERISPLAYLAFTIKNR